MNRRISIVIGVVALAVMFAVIRWRTEPIGGATIKVARLVTEDELERIAKRLPFFLASGADDDFNYYQLREFGYFKIDRATAKNNQPKTKDFAFGLIPVGVTNLFVAFVDGRITVPNSEVLTEANIEAFSPYLSEPESLWNRKE